MKNQVNQGVRPKYPAALNWWQDFIEWPMFILVIFSIPPLFFNNIMAENQLVLLELLIGLVFALELTFRFILYGSNWVSYAKKRWWEAVIVIILLLLPALTLLRAIRSIQALRIIRILARVALLERISKPIRKCWKQTFGRRTLAVMVSLVFIAPILVLHFESGGNGEIDSAGDVFWWFFVTITTVGYGDLYPVTIGGQLMAICLIVSGIIVLGILTTNLTSYLTIKKDADKIDALSLQVSQLTDLVKRLTRDNRLDK